MKNVKSRCFGRLSAPDVRDHRFLIPRKRPPVGVTSRNWNVRGVWDQGFTSQCVAYSSLKWLTAGPVTNHIEPSECKPFYDDCQRNDEWAGEDYDGTSVRAALKVLQSRGYISSYHWAFDVETCADFILTTGPMVFGTSWTDGMMDTDEKGFIAIGENIEGGHAYLINGVNKLGRCPDKSSGYFNGVQSWGDSWGIRGRFKMPFSVAKVLLQQDGEAACALEIKRVAA